MMDRPLPNLAEGASGCHVRRASANRVWVTSSAHPQIFVIVTNLSLQSGSLTSGESITCKVDARTCRLTGMMGTSTIYGRSPNCSGRYAYENCCVGSRHPLDGETADMAGVYGLTLPLAIALWYAASYYAACTYCTLKMLGSLCSYGRMEGVLLIIDTCDSHRNHEATLYCLHSTLGQLRLYAIYRN